MFINAHELQGWHILLHTQLKDMAIYNVSQANVRLLLERQFNEWNVVIDVEHGKGRIPTSSSMNIDGAKVNQKNHQWGIIITLLTMLRTPRFRQLVIK